ncbi:Membrane-bound lytic murein transglycosylase F [Actinoplanes sp. SE50]|uniref:transporter substrate-binding domain-containing protein n=1 Tax=unclassified Actinoplanes TaxID=2626549 RepID=UPI00023EC9A1|nr:MULTISPECIES: transporter substrate-binding domain-containing protein [unclassified Actinoplanes]AEV85379.1 Membrane-bound lytic murein transglycosylase F [Actinoplanes sp. SE50/110]ATO83774.1 Membrane-bound lytic murein transglycosylase F [Actinoplanes sp. SE50]SLM01182.1 murein transglycosylase [Actinoplanes sp. SE50/110]
MGRLARLLLPALLVATGATGCGSATGALGQPVDRLAEARAALPPGMADGGVLVAGTDPTFEPMTFKQGSTYTGLDVQLVEAIAARLRMRVDWRTVSFGDLLDQVQQHKIDLSVSSMFDRAERQKKADFVDYLNAGTSIVVAKGTGDVGGMPGLCGRRVAVQPDTVYVDMAAAQAARCGGRKLVSVRSDNPSAAVAQKAADAALNDFPIAALDVQKNPGLELSGPQIEAIPYGIGIAKDRPALTTAVQTALYSLVDDGTYDALLTKWKVTEGALRTGAVDGGA